MEATFGAGITGTSCSRTTPRSGRPPPSRCLRPGSASGSASSTTGGRSRTSSSAATTSAGGRTTRSAFPSSGGTGEIYRRLAERLGPRVQLGRELVEVDADRRVLRFADGGAEEYDALVATHAARPARRLSDERSERAREAASGAASTTACASSASATSARSTTTSAGCTSPTATCPFYRVTNFAKYAAANVPGGRYRADTRRT